jgi:hypothetical protein
MRNGPSPNRCDQAMDRKAVVSQNNQTSAREAHRKVNDVSQTHHFVPCGFKPTGWPLPASEAKLIKNTCSFPALTEELYDAPFRYTYDPPDQAHFGSAPSGSVRDQRMRFTFLFCRLQRVAGLIELHFAQCGRFSYPPVCIILSSSLRSIIR